VGCRLTRRLPQGCLACPARHGEADRSRRRGDGGYGQGHSRRPGSRRGHPAGRRRDQQQDGDADGRPQLRGRVDDAGRSAPPARAHIGTQAGGGDIMEKNLVLGFGLALRDRIEKSGKYRVVMTRTDDTFIPLETRTAVANQQQADLFVSIHANSSRDANARGVETYYLNFTSSPEALEVAARENAVSEKSIHELGDLVKKIALKEKIEESHEFASNVQQALHSGLANKNSSIRDRGVKKAPFIVLIGANMPSILAEISFVSNPTDERKLQTPEYRQRIAESLYRGIAKYVSGLSGVKVASRVAKNEGQ